MKLIPALLAVTLSFEVSLAEAGVVYRIDTTGGAGTYTEIELVFERTKVTGQMRPYRGYNSPPPVDINGVVSGKEEVELTFNESPPKTIKFRKNISNDKINWVAVSSGSNMAFWKHRGAEFTDYDLALTQSECGPIYKTLSVRTTARVNEDSLRGFLLLNPQLANVPVKLENRPMKLEAALHEILTLGEYDIDVPVGLEVTLTIALRKSDLFLVDLSGGGCDGANASYILVDRSMLFSGDKFLKDNFIAMMERSLTNYVRQVQRGRRWDYHLGEAQTSTLELKPFTSSYRRHVRIASEVSRQVAGYWDTFDVVFEPLELTLKTEYAIVVTLENFESVSRTSGKVTPRSPETFEQFAEANVALLVAFSRSIKGAECFFVMQGDPKTKSKCN